MGTRERRLGGRSLSTSAFSRRIMPTACIQTYTRRDNSARQEASARLKGAKLKTCTLLGLEHLLYPLTVRLQIRGSACSCRTMCGSCRLAGSLCWMPYSKHFLEFLEHTRYVNDPGVTLPGPHVGYRARRRSHCTAHRNPKPYLRV